MIDTRTRPRSRPHSGRGRAGRHRLRPGRTTCVRLRRASRGSAHRRRRHDGPRRRHYSARRVRRQRPVRPCRQARPRRRRDAGRARPHRPRDTADHPPRTAPGLRRQPQPRGRRRGSAADRWLLVQRSPARPRRRLVSGSRVDPGAGHVDVLAIDPRLHRVYAASENGIVSVVQIAHGRPPRLLGQTHLAARAHTVAVDPRTSVVYLPLGQSGGASVLRILRPTRP